jgi:hypothetical protein
MLRLSIWTAQSRIAGLPMNVEFERIREELARTLYCPDFRLEGLRMLQHVIQESSCLGRGLNRTLLRYEYRALPLYHTFGFLAVLEACSEIIRAYFSPTYSSLFLKHEPVFFPEEYGQPI